MGKASARKNIKAKGFGKILSKKKKPSIVLLDERKNEYTQAFGSIPASVIDYLYLGISEANFKAIVRFEIYDYWSNSDLTIESRNKIISAVWRTDGVKDDIKSQKWAKKNEQYIRDYATKIWVELREDLFGR